MEISREGICANNMMFMFLDITEILQSVAEREAAKVKVDWTKKIKPLITQLKWVRTDLLKVIRKCEESTQNDFADDADDMLKLCLLVADRCGSDTKKMQLIYNFIESMPSEEHLNLTKFGIWK